jgi:hypothetical protein
MLDEFPIQLDDEQGPEQCRALPQLRDLAAIVDDKEPVERERKTRSTLCGRGHEFTTVGVPTLCPRCAHGVPGLCPRDEEHSKLCTETDQSNL